MEVERRYVNAYIDKHFHINHETTKVLCNFTNEYVFGREIIDEVISVFGFKPDVVDILVRGWFKTKSLEWYLSAEDELTRVLSEELAASINREIMRKIMDLR